MVVVSSTNRRRRGSVLLFLFFLFVAGRGGAVSSVGAVETVGVYRHRRKTMYTWRKKREK